MSYGRRSRSGCYKYVYPGPIPVWAIMVDFPEEVAFTSRCKNEQELTYTSLYFLDPQGWGLSEQTQLGFWRGPHAGFDLLLQTHSGLRAGTRLSPVRTDLIGDPVRMDLGHGGGNPCRRNPGALGMGEVT